MKLYLTGFLILFLVVLAFMFGSQNDQILSLNYFIAKIELTVAAAVSLFTLIGFIIGILFSVLWGILSKLKARKAQVEG